MVVHSEIPAAHPEKERIEAGLRAALEGLLGTWRLRIICSHIHAWWIVVIEGPRFDWVGLLHDRDEQTGEFAIARVRHVLQQAKLLD